MSVLALLLELARVGIRLEALGGERLRYLTPPGVAMVPYLDHVRALKPEILALLADPDRLRLVCAEAIFATDMIEVEPRFQQMAWAWEDA